MNYFDYLNTKKQVSLKGSQDSQQSKLPWAKNSIPPGSKPAPAKDTYVSMSGTQQSSAPKGAIAATVGLAAVALAASAAMFKKTKNTEKTLKTLSSTLKRTQAENSHLAGQVAEMSTSVKKAEATVKKAVNKMEGIITGGTKEILIGDKSVGKMLHGFDINEAITEETKHNESAKSYLKELVEKLSSNPAENEKVTLMNHMEGYVDKIFKFDGRSISEVDKEKKVILDTVKANPQKIFEYENRMFENRAEKILQTLQTEATNHVEGKARPLPKLVNPEIWQVTAESEVLKTGGLGDVPTQQATNLNNLFKGTKARSVIVKPMYTGHQVGQGASPNLVNIPGTNKFHYTADIGKKPIEVEKAFEFESTFFKYQKQVGGEDKLIPEKLKTEVMTGMIGDTRFYFLKNDKFFDITRTLQTPQGTVNVNGYVANKSMYAINRHANEAERFGEGLSKLTYDLMSSLKEKELLNQSVALSDGTLLKAPDAILANDWHAGVMAPMLRLLPELQSYNAELSNETAKYLKEMPFFMIGHNAAFQGVEHVKQNEILNSVFGKYAATIVENTKGHKDLPEALQHPFFSINDKKEVGMNIMNMSQFADVYIPVSNHYGTEIAEHKELGYALQPMHKLRKDNKTLVGIVNGSDKELLLPSVRHMAQYNEFLGLTNYNECLPSTQNILKGAQKYLTDASTTRALSEEETKLLNEINSYKETLLKPGVKESNVFVDKLVSGEFSTEKGIIKKIADYAKATGNQEFSRNTELSVKEFAEVTQKEFTKAENSAIRPFDETNIIEARKHNKTVFVNWLKNVISDGKNTKYDDGITKVILNGQAKAKVDKGIMQLKDIARKPELLLPDLTDISDVDPSKVPIFSFVGRGSDQKGIDILLNSVEKIVKDPKYQGENKPLVVIGAGFDKHIKDMTLDLKKKLGEDGKRVVILDGWFDEQCRDAMLSSADFFTVPSWFEPCGLTQMQAFSKGCLPIVTNTGGLHDTVNTNNGFITKTMHFFDTPETQKTALAKNVEEYSTQMKNALDLFFDKEKGQPQLEKMAKAAYREDFSWTQLSPDGTLSGPIAEYLDLMNVKIANEVKQPDGKIKLVDKYKITPLADEKKNPNLYVKPEQEKTA